MKTNDLNEAKRLDTKALLEKVKILRGEISDLTIDKSMSKLKDIKVISKKKKEIAQYLTIVRQKQLLEEFNKVQQAVEAEKASVEEKGVK